MSPQGSLCTNRLSETNLVIRRWPTGDDTDAWAAFLRYTSLGVMTQSEHCHTVTPMESGGHLVGTVTATAWLDSALWHGRVMERFSQEAGAPHACLLKCALSTTVRWNHVSTQNNFPPKEVKSSAFFFVVYKVLQKLDYYIRPISKVDNSFLRWL